MNKNRQTYQDHSPAPEARLKCYFQLAAIRLLLAGMYFLLGVSPEAKLAMRERALWLRRLRHDVDLDDVLEAKKNLALAQWSDDALPHWRARIGKLSKSIKENNPYPEAGRSPGTRRTGIMAAITAHQGTDPSSPRCANAQCSQDEGFVVRAPP